MVNRCCFVSLQFLEHLLAGIEGVCGHYGHHHWRDKCVSEPNVPSPFAPRQETFSRMFAYVIKLELGGADDISAILRYVIRLLVMYYF